MLNPAWSLLAAVLFGSAVLPARANVVIATLNASLDSGSLTGVMFPATFSYDSNEVNPIGESFVTLQSFDFVLLGVPFTRNDIFQGGQAIFENGVIENVTASFQVVLPPNSPVNNITFGFGGPGVIGYIDLNDQFGSGTFTFASSVPEPGSFPLLATIALLLTAMRKRERAVTASNARQAHPSVPGSGTGVTSVNSGPENSALLKPA